MSYVSLDSAQLREKKRQLEQYRKKDESLLSDLKRLVRTLNATWKGSSQDAYARQFEGFYSTFTELFRQLKEYETVAAKMADEMEAADNGASSRLRRII